MIPEIILASTSPYRAKQLEQLGLSFTRHAPDVDESEYKDDSLSPASLSLKLAEEKAKSVAKRYPKSIVIGADQVASFDQNVLNKAGSYLKAVDQLELLSGKNHELLTSVCICLDNEVKSSTHVTKLTMRKLNRDFLQRYVELDKSWDCAGSYKFESRGIMLFEKVEGKDPTSIVGLPLMTITQYLLDFGHPLFMTTSEDN